MTEPTPIKAHFFIKKLKQKFAYRPLPECPRRGDLCVFDEVRYLVVKVEWCLDSDASNIGGTKVNLELEKCHD